MTTKNEISNCWVNNKKRGLLVDLEKMDLKTKNEGRRGKTETTKMTSQAGFQARQRYNALMHSESDTVELVNRSQSLPSTVYQPADRRVKRSSTVSLAQPNNQSPTSSILQSANRLLPGSISQPVNQLSTGSISKPIDRNNRSSTGSSSQPVDHVNRSSTGSISQPVNQSSAVSYCQKVNDVNRRTSTGYISQPGDRRSKRFNDVAQSPHSIMRGNTDAGGGGDPKMQRRRSYNGVNADRSRWRSSFCDEASFVGVVGGVCVQSVRGVGGSSSVVGGVYNQSLRPSKHIVSDASMASSTVTSKRPRESRNVTKSTVSHMAKQQYMDPLTNCSPLFQQRIKDLLVLQADTMRQELNKITEQEKRATAATVKKKL